MTRLLASGIDDNDDYDNHKWLTTELDVTIIYLFMGLGC